MATKNEIIEELKELGVEDSKTQLKKRKLEELEELLESVKNVRDTVDEEGNEDEESTKEVVKEGNKEAIVEVVEELEKRLKVFEEFIYKTDNKNSTFEVENLGGGDIYVNGEGVAEYGIKEQLITKGNKVIVKDTDVVSVISPSMALVKITEKK